jgi:hypothetical protein
VHKQICHTLLTNALAFLSICSLGGLLGFGSPGSASVPCPASPWAQSYTQVQQYLGCHWLKVNINKTFSPIFPTVIADSHTLWAKKGETSFSCSEALEFSLHINHVISDISVFQGHQLLSDLRPHVLCVYGLPSIKISCFYLLFM